jgi:hypothetical protein
VKFGRKPSLTARQQREARKRLDDGETQRSVAQLQRQPSDDFEAGGHNGIFCDTGRYGLTRRCA